MPNQLILPPPPGNAGGGCGQCSGVTKYNNTVLGDNCDFSPSPPINPPGVNPFNNQPTPPPGYPTPFNPQSGTIPKLTLPQPISPDGRKPIGPSGIPPQIGQFDPHFFKPPRFIPEPQPEGWRPFTKPCPKDNYNPRPRPVRPIPVMPPQPHDLNPCEPPNWNNINSQRQPLITMCASGNLGCSPNPFQPQMFLQRPDVPPILQSGKRRSANTPEDLCIG